MVERLEVPGVVSFVAVVGYLGVAVLVVLALASFSDGGDIGAVGGVTFLIIAVTILLSVLLFTAIYHAIRDHGRYLGVRLDLLLEQQNELLRRNRPRASEARGDSKSAPDEKAKGSEETAVRCPKCKTVNRFAADDVFVCRSCGHT